MLRAALASLAARSPAPRGGGGVRHVSFLTFPRRGGYVPPDTALYSLLAANAAGFVAWKTSPSFSARHGVVSASSLASGRLWTLLTSAFSHADGRHLAVNAITLYFFGRGVAHSFGGRYLLGLYAAAGVAGSAAHVAASTWRCRSLPPYYRRACVSSAPGALGASSAVNGIVALSCLTWPRAMVYVWGLLPVPAAVLGGLYITQDLLGVLNDGRSRSRGGGGVAYAGHLGGAAVGVAAWALARRRGRLPRW